MPDFEVSYGGKRYTVTVPQGQTQSDAQRYVTQQYSRAVSGVQPKQQPPKEMQHRDDMGALEQGAKSFVRPMQELARFSTHLEGDPVRIEKADREAEERERDFRQRRSGSLGTEAAGAFGEALSPPNAAMMAAPGIGGISRPLRAAAEGAIGGAVGGMSQPVTGTAADDYLTAKGLQGAGGAVIGAPLGALSGALGRGFGRTANPEELRQVTKSQYDVLQNSNLVVSGPAFQRNLGVIESVLHGRQFREYRENQTFRALEEMRNHQGDLNIGDIKGFTDLLKTIGPSTGATPRDAEAARAAEYELTHYFENLPQQHVVAGDPADILRFREASGNYRALKRHEAIQEALSDAFDRASVSGTGANKENAIRQELRKLLNGKYGNYFTPQEREDLMDTFHGDAFSNFARYAGKFAPSAPVSAIPTMWLGGKMGTAALPFATASSVAKNMGEYATRERARDVGQGILRGSPHFQANPPPQPAVRQNITARMPQMLAPTAAGVTEAPPTDGLDQEDVLAR